jgi:peptide/nickel transport system substrate-binding protein
MKAAGRFLLVLAILSMLLVAVASAQEVGPGEGAPIIESNIGDDPATFNPVISSDATSSTVTQYMYPAIVALDPVTLEERPMVDGGLAESWEYDETGTVVTINLRQDLTWSDGTPITANDYMWAADAVRSGLTTSPRTYVFYELADGSKSGGFVYAYEMLDDYTLQFTLGDVTENEDGTVTISPNCVAFSDINDITPVPAHIFSEAFGTDYASMSDDPYFISPATFGAFTNPILATGQSVSMVANVDYPDAQLGYVVPSEWILVNVEDQTVEFERFLAGEFTYAAIGQQNQGEIRAGDYDFQIIEYPSNGYTYMGYNLADPNNPQPGLDENGDYIDQGMHPVLGDVMVRQAFAHAIDINGMIGTAPDGDNPATGILEGNGAPAVTHNHPVSWVDPGLEPYAYDPELAASMLEEAGWVDNDGDGIRECTGCKYAVEVDADYEGTPMSFELLTNAGNNVRELSGQSIQTQLGEIGVDVQFSAIEFSTLVDELLGQQFDAIIIGWNLGLPFDPDGRNFFSADKDRPGSGFGLTSYQNPELEDLWAEAASYPGCDREARTPLYQEAMSMLYRDQPYMWLYYGSVMTAAQANVENFDPLPYAVNWNIDAWTVRD